MNRQYAEQHPGWPVFPALAPAGAWCKAAAVNPMLEGLDADLVVVADADVWTDDLEEAVQAVRDGAPWAIPHHHVMRLTERATDQLLAGALPARPDLCQRAYQGVQGGGIVIAPRQTLLDIPLDPRFTGWGQEDRAWAIALHALAGPAWRGAADLLHLYHPPPERMSRVYGSPDGRRLYRSYVRARRDPAAIRRLIEEGRRHDAHRAPEPAVHDHAA